MDPTSADASKIRVPDRFRRLRGFFGGRRATREGESGAAAVEFALVALPFLAIIFAMLQGALLFFANAYLETVTEKAGRLILTGQAQTQGMSQSQFASKVCGQVVALFKCSSIIIDVNTATDFGSANTGPPTLTYDSTGKLTNTWQFKPGAQGDVVVVRVMYQWPVPVNLLGFTLANLPNNSRLIMSTAVFRNEVY